jgi:Flp pilus assembly protein TadG
MTCTNNVSVNKERPMKLNRTIYQKKRGQGLLEFALITPVMLLLFFGIVDFGWIIFNYSQLYNGLREATRYGSVVGFAGTAQMENCTEIRNRLATTAGFAGIKTTPNGTIKIWYDDGRALSEPVYGTTQSNVVGDCNGTRFNPNNSYACASATICPDRGAPVSLVNGDRVVIDVNVQVNFLTPFIRSLVPQGITLHLRSARSIFPDGLAS